MKPRAFDYVRATDLAHAVGVLAEVGPAGRVLAGGQSLVPLLALRRVAPTVLVDLGRLAELAYIRDEGSHLELGAMTRTRDVELSPLVGRVVPLLPAALRFVGNVTVRNRGTVGGSAAFADPAAELPSVLRALDAELVATGPAGPRTVPAAEFFLGPQRTALQPGEVLTALRVPKQEPGTAVAVEELGGRFNARAVVGVFGAVRLAGGRVAEARLAVSGAGPGPVRAGVAERLLRGQAPTAEVIEAAAAAVAEATAPVDDPQASAEYRRRVSAVLARRCLARMTASTAATASTASTERSAAG